MRYKYFKLPSKLPKKLPKCPDNFILIQDISSQGKYDLTIKSELKNISREVKTKNFLKFNIC